jgi:SAM-dependent methyltransferase
MPAPALNSDTAAYYRKRALDYDEVYALEPREDDLATLRRWVATRVADRTVLEVAAGTGYWTLVAAETARSLVATDINQETLAVAAAKKPGPNVRFCCADAFDLPLQPDLPDTGMAHLWWSHVPARDQGRFLRHLASRLQPRARLLMIDETFVRHLSTPLSRRDADGNTYQTRMLGNGELFEIMKNYPDEATLVRGLEPSCDEIDVLWLPHFWAVSATFR